MHRASEGTPGTTRHHERVGQGGVKLSEYFFAVNALWNGHSLIGIGVLTFCLAIGAYLGHKVSRNQSSNPVVFSFLFIALLVAASIAEANPPLQLMTNPISALFYGAVCGVGRDVYVRLTR